MLPPDSGPDEKGGNGIGIDGMIAIKKTFWFHLVALVTVAIWGTTFISTKVLIANGLTPVDIFFYRFVLAYLCLPIRWRMNAGWRARVFAAARCIS